MYCGVCLKQVVCQEAEKHTCCCAEDDILYPAKPKDALKGIHPAKQEMLLANDLLNAFMGDATCILGLVPVQTELGNTHYVYTLSKENSKCCPDALCEQLQKCETPAATLLLLSLIHI